MISPKTTDDLQNTFMSIFFLSFQASYLKAKKEKKTSLNDLTRDHQPLHSFFMSHGNSKTTKIFFFLIFMKIFFCAHYDWISRIKYIIGTLCYQNNKGNNKWNSEKNRKRKEHRERHIHINSFVTHTRWWEKKMQKENHIFSLFWFTHRHTYIGLS